MNYYLTACGLILHTLFWGAGLSAIALPGKWRRFWWMFAPGCGWALQSAVVWAGAHTSLAGTDAYAWPSEWVPASLLAVAVWRFGRGGLLFAGWRAMAGAVAVGLVAGWLLISPMTRASRGLTSTSLGSCDHADYAAGARVFKEFACDDRTGFLGLPEVTKVRSADYFFDFWLRLNHFTPSALVAHNGTILGLEPWQSISLTAAVLALMNLPVMLLMARALAGLRGEALWLAVAIFGLSPIQTYAVHHGALGQLYAVQGIALATLATVGVGRRALAKRGLWTWLPMLVVAFWLLAGSYNFILTVCLAPAGMWLVGEAWRRRQPAAIVRALGVIMAAVAIVAALFWGRLDGLAERFGLFEQYNFGWIVPLASPEGWLGMVRDIDLGGWPVPVRWPLAALLVGGWAIGVVRLWRRDGARALLVVSLVIPVIAGWAMLAWETRVRANASYDAYKILAVFSPGLIAGMSAGIVAALRGRRGVAALVLALVLGGNGFVAARFCERMGHPPLRVGRDLVQLERLEHDGRISSLNMRIDDFWARLWANSFLLRKPQYFATHTYEGRLNTELKGAWDLTDSMLRSVPLNPTQAVVLNEEFTAVRVGAPGRLDVLWGEGWYEEERNGATRWRWAEERGRLMIENASHGSWRVRLHLAMRSLRAGTLYLSVNGRPAGSASVNGVLQQVEFDDLIAPPGRTLLELRTDAGAKGTVPGDARTLSFALFSGTVQAMGADR